MNFLAIDIGNSLIKTLIQENNKPDFFQYFTTEQEAISYLSSIDVENFHTIICDVRNNLSEKFMQITSQSRQLIILNHETPLPIINSYGTPHTLGYDRIAAVCGAAKLFPQSSILVIVAGTAITYDILTHEKEYIGGAISPGLSLRFKALHEHTSKLPLVHYNNHINFPGKNTQQCIESGVILGVVAEIEYFISITGQQFSPITVILSGGDSQNLVKFIKTPIFVEQNIVLTGLINILKYNVL